MPYFFPFRVIEIYAAKETRIRMSSLMAMTIIMVDTSKKSNVTMTYFMATSIIIIHASEESGRLSPILCPLAS